MRLGCGGRIGRATNETDRGSRISAHAIERHTVISGRRVGVQTGRHRLPTSTRAVRLVSAGAAAAERGRAIDT